MSLPRRSVTHNYAEAVCAKLGKGVLGSVFLHRYNNRTQMKPNPGPEP